MTSQIEVPPAQPHRKTYSLAMALFVGFLSLLLAQTAQAAHNSDVVFDNGVVLGHRIKSASHAQVCSNLSYDSNINRCLAAGRGKWFDGNALRACGNLSYDDNTVECIKAIGNKIYDREVVAVCDDMSYDSEIVKCMSSNGRPYYDQRPDHDNNRGYDSRREAGLTMLDIIRDCRQSVTYDREVLRCVEMRAEDFAGIASRRQPPPHDGRGHMPPPPPMRPPVWH